MACLLVALPKIKMKKSNFHIQYVSAVEKSTDEILKAKSQQIILIDNNKEYILRETCTSI